MGLYDGKIVVVTGASGIGIGQEIAKRFFQEGASVAICSRSEERIQETAREMGSGGRVLALAADMGDPTSIRAFGEAVLERFGSIDVWVNNAGIHFPKPSLEVTVEDWDRTVNVNLRGYFFGAQFAAASMIRQGKPGSIVNIGSVNSVIVTVGETVYAATKAGISKMTENLAREWGPEGIRVNCIAPGSIPTLMNREQYADPQVHKAMCDKLPLRRRGTAKEIADAVLYIASPNASYITGQTLYVDGGLTVVCG